MKLTRRLLVAVDGSPYSEGALGVAAPLLRRTKAPVELLRLVSPLPLASPLRPLRTGQEAEVEEQRTAAGEYLRELGARHNESHGTEMEFTQHVHVADPGSGILDRAEEVQPSLIVMATHGRSGLSRWVRGSVAEKVLRQTRVPLFLVQAGFEKRLRRILVPLDGSKASAKVVPLVAQLAQVFDADEVVLLHVGPGEGAQLAEPNRAVGAIRVTDKLIHDGLKAFKQELKEKGVSARTRADFGDPPEKILEAVTEEEIDLIAMTSHGRTGLDRWAFGSVAEKVLRHCKRPLFLMPLRGKALRRTAGG
jgi:nucleotide-binding universal stress UspA family protein